MTPKMETIYHESVVLNAVQDLRRRLRHAIADASITRIGRSILPSSEGEPQSRSQGRRVDSQSTTEAADTDAETEASPEHVSARHRSFTYRGWRRLKRYGGGSWLYRWLTAEPEPEVIVIDLRETWTAGPIIEWVDNTLRAIAPATLTSGAIVAAARLRNRLRTRPIRTVSLGMIGVGLIALLVLLTTPDPTGPTLLLVIAVLVLALRGTQSTRTWSELQDTRWYRTLADAFEPPEPPGSPYDSTEDADDDRSADSERQPRQ